jgi:hypothetical protein
LGIIKIKLKCFKEKKIGKMGDVLERKICSGRFVGCLGKGEMLISIDGCLRKDENVLLQLMDVLGKGEVYIGLIFFYNKLIAYGYSGP